MKIIVWSVASIGALLAVTVAVVLLAPRAFGLQTFVVLQGSMAPTIPVGAIVIAEPVAAQDIGVGDIITFTRADGSFVTHRVVRIEDEGGQRWFVTKGDANGVEDSVRVRSSGTGWRAVRSVPGIGFLVAALGQAYIRIAFLLIGVLIALRLLIEAVREMTAVRKGNAPAAP